MLDISTAKIIKIGTAKGIIIPVAIMRALGLERGDYLVFGVFQNGQFAARKVSPAELQSLKPKQIVIE